jgi:preprotein translocase subunit SecA
VIGFRSYGQRDPLNEYKSEGFQLFEGMLARLREDVTGELMHIKVGENQPLPAPEEEAPLPPMQAHHINPMTGEDEFALAEAVLAAERSPPVRAPSRPEPVKARKTNGAVDPQKPETWGKVSRNAPCPCGSGKKYKHCHGRH